MTLLVISTVVELGLDVSLVCQAFRKGNNMEVELGGTVPLPLINNSNPYPMALAGKKLADKSLVPLLKPDPPPPLVNNWYLDSL